MFTGMGNESIKNIQENKRWKKIGKYWKEDKWWMGHNIIECIMEFLKSLGKTVKWGEETIFLSGNWLKIFKLIKDINKMVYSRYTNRHCIVNWLLNNPRKKYIKGNRERDAQWFREKQQYDRDQIFQEKENFSENKLLTYW